MSEAHMHSQLGSFFALATLAGVALVYARGWWCLQRAGRGQIPMWRPAAFIGGLFLLWMVVWSSVAALDHESLTIHMVNHLVLMLAAAPLILAGNPVSPLLLGLPARLERGLRGFYLRSLAARSLARVFSHPVFCWLFAAGAVVGWHVPPVFQLAMRSHWWHGVEYASFTLAGLLFWRPVMHAENRSRWFVTLYLFLATLPCDILSAFLAFCDRVVYPSYLSGPGLFHLPPLQDQQCASALMWVSVTVAYLIPAAAITTKILSPSGMYSQQGAQHLPGSSPMSTSRVEVV